MGFLQKNDPKTTLIDIIQRTSLEEKQKSLWFSLIENMDQEAQMNILAVLKDNSDNLDILTQNLQKKYEAVKNKDVNAWRNIIAEEKKFLNQKLEK